MSPRVARLVAPGLALCCHGCLELPRPSATRQQIAALRRLEFPVDSAEPGPRVAALATAALQLPRVVYVHGTPGNAKAWGDYLVEPIAGHDAVALDRPGFGVTGGPVRTSLAAQADAVAQVCAPGRSSVLVGHSLGGPVVLQAAVDHPERVRGVVVIAGSVDPELESLRWYNWLGWLFEPVLPRALRHGNREIRGLRPELEQLRERLGEVRCPVTIVHGRRDSLVPYGNVDFLLERLTGAERVEVVTLDAADHFLIWRDRYEPVVRAAIAALLEQVTPREVR